MIGSELGLGCDPSRIGNLMIVNGNITARSSPHHLGIGIGYTDSNGTLMIWNLMLISGNITASNSSDGSGIGTGIGEGDGTSMTGDLMIVSGNITASSSFNGSGIGMDCGENMHCISGSKSSAITSGTLL
jgi:hypothetical protein